ncbi:hypothetical protein GJAV_G00036000 [Gymnothorax javanicus]|nr:hypothetical protein GJAV_G00036000 [Gymnothorax javanicus]
MDRRTNQRSVCNKKFTERSNLTRHMKIRAPKQNDCDMCGKNFSTKQQLNSHLRQQQYPHIPLYRQGEASRLLYLVIKLLKNRPPANDFSSPHKSSARSQQKIHLQLYCKGGEKTNDRATVTPKAKPHQTAVGQTPARSSCSAINPPTTSSTSVQYQHPHHSSWERRGEKRRLDFAEPEPVNRPIQPKPAAASYAPPAVSAAPSTPHTCSAAPCTNIKTDQAQQILEAMRGLPSTSVWWAAKRYTPSKDKAAGSSQKIFTYCPATRKSTTSASEGVVYTSFQHFKSVLDTELEKRRNS